MSFALDSYMPGSSLLHRLDPRVKLWGLLLAGIALFLTSRLVSLLCFLLLCHLVLLRSGIPWRALGRLWRQMAFVVALMLLLNPLLRQEGTVLMSIGPMRLTVEGVTHAALLATRTMTLGFLLAALLFTTEQTDLLRALVRLGIPYTWGLTISLTLRFLPAIRGLFLAVQEAQAARGWMPAGSLMRRLRGYFPVVVAVIIGTLRLSDQLTLALVARGLAACKSRTVWHDLRMRTEDWAVLVLSGCAFILLVVWRMGWIAR